MEPKNEHKHSEYDLVSLVWIPVFKALFSIDHNMIRLKTGETVPNDSSEGREFTLYNDSGKSSTGFKVDIRSLFNHNDFEFDPGGAIEACVPQPLEQKIDNDPAKLLREGKGNINRLHKGIFGDQDSPCPWILQVIGFTTHMSSVHSIGNHLAVGVLQKTISFPTSISQLPSGKDLLCGLFMLRDSIEKSAHKIRCNITSKNQLNRSTHKFIESTGSPMLSPLRVSELISTMVHSSQKRSFFCVYNTYRYI